MRLSILLLLLAAAVMARPAAAEEEWLLRFDLEPDTKYRLEMVTEQSGRVDAGAAGGSEIAATNRIELSQRLAGRDEAGNLRVSWVYDRMVTESDIGGNQVTIDSDQPTDDPAAEALSTMIGREVVVVISPRGEVLSVEGLDEILGDLYDHLSEGPETQGLRQLMEQSFGEDQVKYLMQASVAVYPEDPISIGDRWDFDLQMDNPLMGTVNMLNSYEATGLDATTLGPCLAADFSTEMEFESGGMLTQLTELFKQQGADVQVDMDLEVEDAHGDICVDLATGLVSRLRQQVDLVMTMGMQISAGAEPQNLEMAMDMSVITNLRVIGTEPLPPE